MRLIVGIWHPAHVHFFKNMIWNLEKKGHEIKIVTRSKEITLELLDSLGFDYENIAKHSKGLIGKVINVPKTDYAILKIVKDFKPDILTGILDMYNAQVGKLIGKPCIIFTDTEYTKYGNFITFPFMSAICTPDNFLNDLGSKHIKYLGFHELAYLWPKYFEPNPSILDELGVEKDEKFVIMRFVAFKAHHDIGVTGFTLKNKISVAEKLSKYSKVFISSESKLPKKLEKYRFHLSSEKFQNALYYAHLYFADSQTTTTEAACLGTPAIRCNTFACSPQERSNFIELEERYDLIKNINVKDQEMAIDIAVDWIKKDNLKKVWAKKRQKLLKDKIDVTAFMSWFLEEYPKSFQVMKNDPSYQRRFR